MRRLSSALNRGRSAAESRMRAVCVIERPGAATTNDEGELETSFTHVYHGKCRIADFNAHPSTPEVAGQLYVINQPRLLVPHDAPDVQPNDRVTILSDADNPGNAGRVLQVDAIRRKSQETARHLIVDDIQSGTR